MAHESSARSSVERNQTIFCRILVFRFKRSQSLPVYCLHAFQKKTQKTSSQDLAVIKARYAALKELDDE
ncbi:hypothetical protein FXE10_03215 [Aggregatibacter actinomycetemcomitans]|nr:hypothetical protein FXE10_03215 [Aggregatibacter actinomycetemcomitans]